MGNVGGKNCNNQKKLFDPDIHHNIKKLHHLMVNDHFNTVTGISAKSTICSVELDNVLQFTS